MENKLIKLRILRFSFVILCLIGLSYMTFIAFSLVYPFLIGLLLALAINPLVNFFERRFNVHRGISAITSIFLGILAIVLFTTFIVTEIIAGSNYLAKALPPHINSLITHIEEFVTLELLPVYSNLATHFNNLDPTYQKGIIDNMKNFGTNVGTTLGTGIENTFKSIPTFLSKIPNFATVLIFSLLATFFISKDMNKFRNMYNKYAPKSIQEKLFQIISNLKHALLGFIKAQFILISITGVIVLIGLLLLGVEHAITISIVIAIFDLMPLLGTGLIFVPWIIYSFLSGNIILGIGLSALYLITIIQRQIAEPKILSTNIGLDPLATLMSLFIGYQLFSFVGLIIGPITLVFFKALYQANALKDTWTFIKFGKEKKSPER